MSFVASSMEDRSRRAGRKGSRACWKTSWACRLRRRSCQQPSGGGQPGEDEEIEQQDEETEGERARLAAARGRMAVWVGEKAEKAPAEQGPECVAEQVIHVRGAEVEEL